MLDRLPEQKDAHKTALACANCGQAVASGEAHQCQVKEESSNNGDAKAQE
jgi:hypothetical protein